MKKIAVNIFIVLFFIICLTFSVGLIIPSAADDDGTNPPSLIENGSVNSKFGNELEEWFSKHFAFHGRVTDLYADIKTALFGEGNSQVIIGKEDFLFFADTVPDYIGSDPISNDELAAIADGLLEMQSEVEKNGGKFLFVCAPNKNTVYSEKMPGRYKKSTDDSNMDRLYAELDKRNVDYADLRPALRAEKKDALIYHKRDSHWNGLGAKAAVDEIAKVLGFNAVDLSSQVPSRITDFEGDLDALLYSDKIQYDENTVYDFTDLYVYTSAFSNEMDMVIEARGGGEGKLLMYRDSFANAMIPYLAASLNGTRLQRGTPYSREEILSYSPDYVIVEIAERNIKLLTEHLGITK